MKYLIFVLLNFIRDKACLTFFFNFFILKFWNEKNGMFASCNLVRLLSFIRLIEADRNGEQDLIIRTSVETFLYRIQSVELWRDIYGRVHVFPHTLSSMFGRAANPEFRRSLLTHLRTVRYASLYRLLFRTSGLGCVPIIPDTWISLILAAEFFKALTIRIETVSAAKRMTFHTVYISET